MSQNNQNKPEISVLMSVYAESADAINVAVESILNQSFSNFEFIIVNDNPARAETRRVLDTLSTKDDRIQVLTNDRNRGLGYALNAALQRSRRHRCTYGHRGHLISRAIYKTNFIYESTP